MRPRNKYRICRLVKVMNFSCTPALHLKVLSRERASPMDHFLDREGHCALSVPLGKLTAQQSRSVAQNQERRITMVIGHLEKR